MRSRRSSGRVQHFRRRSAHAYISDIHDRMPVAAKLANLLGIDIEQQVCAMPGTSGARAHVLDIKSAARNRSQDPHERALRIAIMDVKCVHVFLPSLFVFHLFVVEQHLGKRRARRHHRIHIRFRSAVKHKQLRLR